MVRSIIALSLVSLAGSAAAQVTAGPVVNPANGHRYYLLAPASRSAHLATAASLGGTLATINDAAENAWVQTTVASANGNASACLIGLNDQTTEGTFVWNSGEPLLYTNWGPGEPNDEFGEDFVAITPADGFWNDIPVSSVVPAIVEVTGPMRVPSEYSTIQSALAAAAEGQTILVAPGTYVGNFSFGVKNLKLIAEQGPDVTTIRTSGSGSGVLIQGNQGPQSVLQGFTIIPRSSTLWTVYVDSAATIRGCRIGGATNYGIYALGSATITDCVLAGNGFGGILASASSRSIEVTVQNCTIAGSTIGGIVTSTRSDQSAIVRVTNSIVTGNAQATVLAPRSAVFYSYSHVQEGAPGVGNSSANPGFINAPGSDGLFRLSDNYALAADSPCIDSGSNTARVATLDQFPLDASGKARFADFALVPDTGVGPGAIVDRGALETQPPACPADFNADSFLDFFDYDAFVQAFEEGC
jgi:hypothetical protein